MLKLQNISYAIPNRYLFENISQSLSSKENKKIALLGMNGAGKSSLMKVIAGIEKPDTGQIIVQNETIGYVPQELSFPNKFEFVGEYLESLLDESWHGYLLDIALDHVGLPNDFVYQAMAKLSGGEKVKTYILGLLLQEPSIILMDEATNHLDQESVSWLGSFIEKFKGSIVLITHDRAFINTYIDTIWDLNPQTKNIDVIMGKYDDFIAFKNKEYNKALQVYNQWYEAVRSIRMWLRENEFHPKYQFSSIVGSKKRTLDHLLRRPVIKPVKIESIRFHDLYTDFRGRLIKAVIKKKTVGDKVILENKEIIIKRAQRVLISGANGTGKTTLMNILSGKDTEIDGFVECTEGVKIGYLSQFPKLDESKNVLQAFEYETGLIEPESRKVLARYLFQGDMVFQGIGNLSYGEKRRLELAIILTQDPDILFMDEPTNHLDIYAREALENFLVDLDIAFVVISHDKYFIEKIGFHEEIKL